VNCVLWLQRWGYSAATFFTVFAFHTFFIGGICFFSNRGFFSIATTTGKSHCKCSEGHDQNRFLD
jgi:hypothetical protein